MTNASINVPDSLGNRVSVACCQLPLDIDDQRGNRRRVEAALTAAKHAGSSVVVLPELANTGYMFSEKAELLQHAEPTNGPTVQHWEKMARDLDLVIVGGFAELGTEGSIFNSAALIDSTGLRAVYRKAHLWDWEKNDLFTAGNELPPVVDTEAGRIAVMICYDLDFPELFRHIVDAEADLLCAPVNWPLCPRPAGERPAEIIRAQAEAGRSRLAIACADRVGPERGQDWLGGSTIINAEGFPIACAELGQPGTIVGTLDLASSRNKWISERNNVRTDRRIDLYPEIRGNDRW